MLFRLSQSYYLRQGLNHFHLLSAAVLSGSGPSVLLTQSLGGPAPSLLLCWEPPDRGVWCGAVCLGPHRGPARSPAGDTPGSTHVSSQPSPGLHVEHGVGPTRLPAERTRAFLGRLLPLNLVYWILDTEILAVKPDTSKPTYSWEIKAKTSWLRMCIENAAWIYWPVQISLIYLENILGSMPTVVSTNVFGIMEASAPANGMSVFRRFAAHDKGAFPLVFMTRFS